MPFARSKADHYGRRSTDTQNRRGGFGPSTLQPLIKGLYYHRLLQTAVAARSFDYHEISIPIVPASPAWPLSEMERRAVPGAIVQDETEIINMHRNPTNRIRNVRRRRGGR